MILQPTEFYQIYYRDDQKSALEPLARPWDNSHAKPPHVFEYSVIIESYKTLGRVEGYRGFLSWKFGQKTQVSLEKWAKDIEVHPGYDVYFINPYIEQAAFDNIWQQGEYFHPGLINKSNQLLRAVGNASELSQCGFDLGNIAYCNYWVGNEKFWSLFIPYLEKYYNFLKANPNSEVALDLQKPADQKIGAPYLPFFFERLFSNFLVLNPEVKVKAYSYTLEDLTKKFKSPLALEILALQSAHECGDKRGYNKLKNTLKSRLFPLPHRFNIRGMRNLAYYFRRIFISKENY